MADQSRHASAPASWADPVPLPPVQPLWRRALPLLVWLGCLGAAVVLLLALGGGRLAAPALTEPSTWAAWSAGRDPVEVTMVVLRVLALGLAWYLVGVTSISVVARVLRAARLVRLADALSVGPVRVLVQQTVGVGLAASVLATAVPGPTPAASSAGAQPDDARSATVVVPPVDERPDAGPGPARAVPVRFGTSAPTTSDREVLVPVPAPGPPPHTEPAATATPAPAATATPAPAATATPAPAATATPTPAARTATQATEPVGDSAAVTGPVSPDTGPGEDGDHAARASSAPREVRVRPGDHFWSLAEQEVAAHLGRPGSEVEVLAHWQATVEANADRLEVPGNPDLLLPGQLVVLPPAGEVLP